MTPPILAVSGVDKTFTMHLQGGQRLPVLRELAFEVYEGECVALGGASGAGKSSILKMVYGNYAVDRGSIVLQAQGRVIDIAAAGPRQVLAARRDAVGYVSQFLRCVPRVAALQIVAEPLLQRGVRATEARDRAATARQARHPRAAVGAAARHLLRWRAAAREHRARIRHRAAAASA